MLLYGAKPVWQHFLYRGVSSETGPHLPVQVRLARDLGDCLQSRNVPFGTSGDYLIGNFIRSNKNIPENAFLRKFGVRKMAVKRKDGKGKGWESEKKRFEL